MTALRLLRRARGTGLAACVAATLLAAPAAARAEEAWLEEFAAVCSKTQDAMTLSVEELRSLVERCDALVPAIARLEEPRRKVYTRRLEACRNLYQFVLDSRAPRVDR